MEKWLDILTDKVQAYGPNLLAALAILLFGWFFAGLLKAFLKRLLIRGNVDKTLAYFATNLGYVAFMAFVVIAALSKLGIQTASFIAVIGAAGLAIGFALQGSLSNFASGVLLIIYKPFKVGDYIEGGGISGSVEEVTIFTTELKSPDNKKIIVPNAKITSDSIINYSAKSERRVDLVVGVSYNDNLSKVRDILTQIISEDTRILKEPEPTIAVLELADSSINFAVRPWVKTPDYWGVYFDLNEKIKNRFDEEGISIPFPQQDVHLYKSSS